MPGIANLYTLLDPAIAVHILLVDDLPAATEALNRLPLIDIVLNAISDPDFADQLANAAALCSRLGLPVFNHPDLVRELNRASLAMTVSRGSDNVMAAKAVFLPPGRTANSDIETAIKTNRLRLPVILRSPGFQGGKQMKLIRHGSDELGEDLYRDDGLYCIEFVDVSFRDDRAGDCRLYAKYRAFYADGELYPIHLFVADHFNVHKKTADPVRSRYPWLADWETNFLDDPARQLPEGLWDGLKTAVSSFGLDYVGVDFAVSTRPDDGGKLVIFECNAAMANRIVVLPEGDRVQRQWHDVTLAAHAALCRKSGVPAWPFALKKGLPVQPIRPISRAADRG